MNKKAMVTGASRGIGKETARILAKGGYDLYLVCRHSEDELKQLKEELEQNYKIGCETFLCDVSDWKQVEVMFGQIKRVDVLINNAAVSYIGLLSEMPVDKWQEVIGTNLSSMFYLCRQVIPGMVYQKSGKIINISSVWGNKGASMEVAYSASKGGVNSFTRALASELAPSGIQVNAVAFGMIETGMNTCYSNEELQALKEEIPAGRMGSPGEAAQMINQILAAPDYFTGQVVTMDGGWI